MWRADEIGESKDPILIRNGIGECEIFAVAYRPLGLATVRHPVAQMTGRVKPFDSRQGFTPEGLRVERARQD